MKNVLLAAAAALVMTTAAQAHQPEVLTPQQQWDAGVNGNYSLAIGLYRFAAFHNLCQLQTGEEVRQAIKALSDLDTPNNAATLRAAKSYVEEWLKAWGPYKWCLHERYGW